MTEEVLCGQGGAPLATLVSPRLSFSNEIQASAVRRYRLSRFAYLHRVDDDVVLECPFSAARVVLHAAPAIALVVLFCQPAVLADSVEDSEIPVDQALRLVVFMAEVGMLAAVDEGDGSDLQSSPGLATWEFHDLLFHTCSRAGRHDRPTGGTYRFLGRIPPPPPIVEGEASEHSIMLAVPDLGSLEHADPPLAAVQEARRSVRHYTGEPISLGQLGEFLYRVGRLADFWRMPLISGSGPIDFVYAARPYPSAGAMYELELYCAIAKCQGASPGLYRYEPQHHRLDRRAEPGPDVQQLLTDAARGAGMDVDHLQVLIVVTARMPRMAWKYESIAYSLMLKDVGVLYETMYLSATAMGLGPCALGCGDSDLFARAAATDYYAESSVGEFLLGAVGRATGRSRTATEPADSTS